jgi:hypothetical protein
MYGLERIIGRIQRVSATLLAAQLQKDLVIGSQPASPKPFRFFAATTQYNNRFRVPFQPPLRHEPTGSPHHPHGTKQRATRTQRKLGIPLRTIYAHTDVDFSTAREGAASRRVP